MYLRIFIVKSVPRLWLNHDAEAMSFDGWLLHRPKRQLCYRIMRKKFVDPTAGDKAVVPNVDVVLTWFAHHIGHVDLICNPIKSSRLEPHESVHAAFCGRRR